MLGVNDLVWGLLSLAKGVSTMRPWDLGGDVHRSFPRKADDTENRDVQTDRYMYFILVNKMICLDIELSVNKLSELPLLNYLPRKIKGKAAQGRLVAWFIAESKLEEEG